MTRLMKELAFQFEDALLRVGNVKLKEDEGGELEDEKKKFLEREKGSVKGVMRLVSPFSTSFL